MKYTPPGRLGSPKQQRAAEKAREQRAAEAAAEEEEFVVEKLVGTRKEEDGPREFQVSWRCSRVQFLGVFFARIGFIAADA